jgi:hypothetical protein
MWCRLAGTHRTSRRLKSKAEAAFLLQPRRMLASLGLALTANTSCRLKTRPLGHLELARVDVANDHPSAVMPELDIFPPDMPMSAFPSGSKQLSNALSHVSTSSNLPLFDNGGHAIDVASPCNGSATYSMNMKLVWTNKTHPDYPVTGTAWSSISVVLHDDRCVFGIALFNIVFPHRTGEIFCTSI